MSCSGALESAWQLRTWVRWVSRSGCSGTTTPISSGARCGGCFVAAGDSVATQQLRGRYGYWNARACEAACQGGSLLALKWLRRNGCDWDMESLHVVLKRGDRKMLTWLQDNGAPFTEGTAGIAARRGDMPTLTWLHQAGVPCHAGLEMAAKKGNLDILKWGVSKCLLSHGRTESLTVLLRAPSFTALSLQLRMAAPGGQGAMPQHSPVTIS